MNPNMTAILSRRNRKTKSNVQTPISMETYNFDTQSTNQESLKNTLGNRPSLCRFIYDLVISIWLFIVRLVSSDAVLKPLDEQDSDTESSVNSTETGSEIAENSLSESFDELYSSESSEDYDPDQDSNPETDSDEQYSEQDSEQDSDMDSDEQDSNVLPIECVRRCRGVTSRKTTAGLPRRCKITNEMAYDKTRASYTHEASLRMISEGSNYCSYHANQEDVDVCHTSVHPVIYGIKTPYRATMSSLEKQTHIQEAYEEDRIPLDSVEAWGFIMDNKDLQKVYGVDKLF